MGGRRAFSLLVTLFVTFALGEATPGLCGPRVMEIQPRPAGGGEWIEILNPGEFAVDLTGWSLWDATRRRRVLSGNVILKPGRRLVLAAKPDSLRAWYSLADSIPVVRPSGWPVLNDSNAGDGPADYVVLADAAGMVVDSMAYYASWLAPEKGRSLERVSPDAPATDPASWGWSAHAVGATPGTRNSLAGSETGDQGRFLDGPSRVSPGRAPAVFRYRMPGPGTLALWLLDNDGRRVALLRPPGPAPAVGSFVWGASAPGPSRAGTYLLCLLWQAGSSRMRECRSLWVTP